MNDLRERTAARRWLKVLALVVVAVGLLVVVMLVIGGGGHTPRPHGPFGADATANPHT